MVNENDLEEILAQELERIKECGERINLAETERRTGISRAVLRRWQRNGYSLANDKRGRSADNTKTGPFSKTIEALLRKGVTNSSVIIGRIRELGYNGGILILKDYIRSHHDLVPSPRHAIAHRGTEGADTPPSAGTATRWTWFSSIRSTLPAMNGGAHVSSWCATTADSGIWSSSQAPGRRTCS